uniref:Seminal fluid protein HACP041 n=1 Tax=Heliconius melpomene TaxID=34740 RepID=D9HQ91_HELME|nr:seminal fluid protein HACP041 [Heliconius melpomene]
MKTFLFTILTAILVHHTIQYENVEERQLLHTENSPKEHEEDSHNLRRGDIKDLTNIKDTEDLQPYSENYQTHYRELKDREIVRPLTGLRSTSEIKNWVKDMIAMRRRGRGGGGHGHHHPRPPHTLPNRPRPKPTTNPPKHKDLPGGLDNTEEEQILLEYTPKHKKVDVPMIIFVPLRE